MANWKPELHDKDSIINYYEQFDSPYFNLYAGNRAEEPYLRWDYLLNDKSRGVQVLSDALDSILANPNNNNTYLLQILMEEPKEPKKTPGRVSIRGRNKPLSKNITFQLNAVNTNMQPYYAGAMVAGYPSAQGNDLKELIKQNGEMLELLKSRLVADDRETEPAENDNMGVVGAILNNPTYAPLIEAAVVSLISKLLPNQGDQAPGKINGVPEVNQEPPLSLEQIMERLGRYGMTYDDMLGLEKFARNNTIMFKIYLGMLRAKF